MDQAVEKHPFEQKIPDRYLIPLRLIWILIALVTVVITVLGIAAFHETFRLPCELQPAESSCLVTENALGTLGLTRSFYANWLVVGIVIELFPWFLAALLIFWRRSDSWFRLFFSLSIMLVGSTIIDLAIPSWTAYAYPAAGLVIEVISTLGNLLFGVWFFFPNGRLVTQWTRWLLLLIVFRAIASWNFSGTVLDANSWPEWLHIGLNFAIGIGLAYAIFYRYRYAANREQRQQIKWIVTSAVIMIGLYILQTMIFLTLEEGVEVVLGHFTITPLYYLSSGLLASSIVIAIFRYNLFDIDIIIRRTLVYSLLTGALVVIYFGSVVVVQTAVNSITGRSQSSQLTIVLSTLLIAALFTPLRRRIQAFIDRRFYRRKYDATQALAQFARTARDEVALEALTAEINTVLQNTLQPSTTSFWVLETKEVRK